MVLIASSPKLPLLSTSEYASSMKRTPPLASLNFEATIFAVQPTYLPTRSDLPHSTYFPVSRIFSFLRISAISLATVVLADPGLDVFVIDENTTQQDWRDYAEWCSRLQ